VNTIKRIWKYILRRGRVVAKGSQGRQEDIMSDSVGGRIVYCVDNLQVYNNSYTSKQETTYFPKKSIYVLLI
jgi:hypothetical protein